MIDTNILVYLLQGNPRVEYFALEEILSISCITEMETLGKFQISDAEKDVIMLLLARCNIIDINLEIKHLAIELRQKYRLKLPDALVAATAIQQNVALVTADKGFSKISELDLLLINL